MTIKVSFQGENGAYSQEAIYKYFKDQDNIETLERN